MCLVCRHQSQERRQAPERLGANRQDHQHFQGAGEDGTGAEEERAETRRASSLRQYLWAGGGEGEQASGDCFDSLEFEEQEGAPEK